MLACSLHPAGWCLNIFPCSVFFFLQQLLNSNAAGCRPLFLVYFLTSFLHTQWRFQPKAIQGQVTIGKVKWQWHHVPKHSNLHPSYNYWGINLKLSVNDRTKSDEWWCLKYLSQIFFYICDPRSFTFYDLSIVSQGEKSQLPLFASIQSIH